MKKIIAQNPGKNHKEIMSIMGAQWKSLTAKDKEKYELASKADISKRQQDSKSGKQ